MSKRKLSRHQNWRIQKIQEERKARANKRAQHSEELLSSGELGEEQAGLVIAHYGIQVDVEALSGPLAGSVQRCHVRSNLKQLVTGDHVVWCAGEPTGVIVAQQDRSSVILRPDPYGKLKPVAANIDQMIIVIASEPTPHCSLIDRYLIAAELSEIKPILLINKSDLIEDQKQFMQDQNLDIYPFIGIECLFVSADESVQTNAEQNNLSVLCRLLSEKTSVFVGQSGVGKSSIINALLPDAQLPVGELSESSGKGSHTTTTAKLFHFAFEEGGDLIDSPGIREFSLWHLDPNTLIHHFIEFRPFIGHCKFRDCAHLSEPKCAIRQAVENGKVSEQRLESYFKILETMEEDSR